MPKIKQLEKEVSELIAAGEVVERPASVVKELVENSIDAGASNISVEINNGGMTYIRVADNGCGIEREDVGTAFLRHATSKIRSKDDLFGINTLGFRGEALAAAAAVSKIDMLTKTAGEKIGTHIRVEAGETISVSEAGCPEGTTIIIRDLFYNMPARLKFMKRDATEAGYITDVIIHAALSDPQISFCLIKNGKREFFSPGDGNPQSVLYSAYGRTYPSELLPVFAEYEGIKITGFVSKPENSRSNRSMQDFFVNKRYIRSKIICTALEEAYKERIMSGKFPSCLLYIEINPNTLDVNVHPAKTEIKFSDDKRIYNAVYIAVKTALDNDLARPLAQLEDKEYTEDTIKEEQTKRPEVKVCTTVLSDRRTEEPAERKNNYERHEASTAAFTEYRAERYLKPEDIAVNSYPDKCLTLEEDANSISLASMENSLLENMPENNSIVRGEALGQHDSGSLSTISDRKDGTDAPVQQTLEQSDGLNRGYRIVGEILNTYIVVEDSEGILLIDKHAAHERMIFNKISENPAQFSAQKLLSPETVMLKPSELQAVLENSEILRKLGFELEEFGSCTVLVRSIPSYINERDISTVVSELAEKLTLNSRHEPEMYVKIAERLSCLAAVKANSITTDEERESFVGKLMSMPEIKYCPHGRPIAIRVTKQQLEKQFKRIV